jgi:hypothetical protein
MSLRFPTKTPVAIGATWVSRFWTSNPPRYDPHTDWTIRISISSTTPFRLARLVGEDQGWSIDKSSERGCEFTFAIGNATEVEPTPIERSDPWRSLGVSAPVAAMTWSVIPLSTLSDRRSQVALLAFSRQDTETLRGGRWRLREELWPFLPIDSDGLRHGQRGRYWPVESAPWQQKGNN